VWEALKGFNWGKVQAQLGINKRKKISPGEPREPTPGAWGGGPDFEKEEWGQTKYNTFVSTFWVV